MATPMPVSQLHTESFYQRGTENLLIILALPLQAKDLAESLGYGGVMGLVRYEVSKNCPALNLRFKTILYPSCMA